MIQPTENIKIDIKANDSPITTLTTMDKVILNLIVARTGIKSYDCVGVYTNEKIDSIRKFTKETTGAKMLGFVVTGVVAAYLLLSLPHLITLNPATDGFDFVLAIFLFTSTIVPFMSVMFILMNFFPIKTKHCSTKTAFMASLPLTAVWVIFQYLFSTIVFPYPKGAFLAYLVASTLLAICFMGWYLYTEQANTCELKKGIIGYALAMMVQMVNAFVFPEAFNHFMTIKSDHLLAGIFVAVVFPLIRKSNKAILSMSQQIIGRPTPWIGVALTDCYYLFFLALTIQHSEGFTTMYAILIFNCLSLLLERWEYMGVLALNEKNPGTVKQSAIYIMLEDSAMRSFYEIMVPFIYSMLIRFIVKLSPNRNYLVIFHEFYYTEEQFDQTEMQLLVSSGVGMIIFLLKTLYTSKFDIDFPALLVYQLHNYRFELAAGFLLCISSGLNAVLMHVGP